MPERDEKDMQHIGASSGPAASTLELTTQVLVAFLSRNTVKQESLAPLLTEVHGTMSQLAASPNPGHRAPAVPIEKSIEPDHLVCLECGARLKGLKRHLAAKHKLSPIAYRAKWSLPADYPMICEAFGERQPQDASGADADTAEDRAGLE